MLYFCIFVTDDSFVQLVGSVSFTSSLQGVTTISDYSVSQMLHIKDTSTIFQAVALHFGLTVPGSLQREKLKSDSTAFLTRPQREWSWQGTQSC